MSQDQGSAPKSKQAQGSPLSGQNLRTPDETHQLFSATFSIATPTVTTILPMTENINDTSFMLPATSYQQDSIMDKSFSIGNNGCNELKVEEIELSNHQRRQMERVKANTCLVAEPPQEQMQSCQADPNLDQPVNNNHHEIVPQEYGSKICKKRNKVTKKSTKLDAKSKLEKSRQSARECRARKKLRYQYLEDLVTNREKAVIKLREELSMFCELSRQIDVGTINEADRKLLIDQTKENSRSEPANL